MAEQQVTLQQKKELTPAEERTEAGRFFSPYTDIHETAGAVVVTMGPRVLRSETAGIVAAALVLDTLGEMGS